MTWGSFHLSSFIVFKFTSFINKSKIKYLGVKKIDLQNFFYFRVKNPEMDSEWSLSKNFKGGEYKYNRTGHSKEYKVKSLLSNNYNVNLKQVSLASSGIESFAFTLQIIMIENRFRKFNVIYSNELYCDTPRYFKYFQEIYGVTDNYPFDVDEPQKLKADFNSKFKDQINVLFFETCSNPTGKILDFSIIPHLRSLSKKLYVVVDNTWLSSASFNPFNHGADIVVSSTSKYYSRGSCIGGFIISPPEFAKNLNNFIRIGGHHISLPYCDKLIEHIPTMEDRIKKTSAITAKVAILLESLNKIKKVYHPSLPSNASHTLASKYFKYMPSVISFELDMNIAEAKVFMKNVKGVHYKTSFGAKETKFNNWPKKLTDSTTRCRLAIGTDCNLESLCNEFQRKLN